MTNNTAESIIETGELTEQVKQAALDAMISGRSDAAPHFARSPAEKSNATASAEWNRNGSVNFASLDLTEEELFARAQQIAADDDGTVDYDGAAKSSAQRLDDLRAKLNEHSYDPQTGARIYKVEGRARDVLQMSIRLAEQQTVLDTWTAQAVRQARAAHAGQIEARIAEDALRLAWAGHDPARNKALSDALLRAEADDVARKILELRKR
jgi:hypothetical protein